LLGCDEIEVAATKLFVEYNDDLHQTLDVELVQLAAFSFILLKIRMIR